MTVIDERLATLASLHLQRGGHPSFDDGLCVMEAAAWIAGEDHSDHPACVSPVVTAFMVSWNDSLPTDADRDRLLKPLIPLLIGTRTTAEDEEARAWMATDWLAREQAPAWLRLAGLTDHAEALENLAALTGRESAVVAQPTLAAARDAAGAAAWAAALDAAWAAAGAAAGAAARAAARDAAGAAALAAAGAAAWAAARDAARAAARDAAWAAARAAALAAARDALAPTVEILQTSATLLVKRMCEVGR